MYPGLARITDEKFSLRRYRLKRVMSQTWCMVGVLGCSLCWPFGAFCQSAPRDVRAVRTEHPPRLDGIIDESWTAGARISELRQREPFEGRPATEKTVVRILYDRHYLYFGLDCLDSKPDGIVANELRRDTDFTVDDYLSIMISPNNDARNRYIFTTNPLGTQLDALIADDG